MTGETNLAQSVGGAGSAARYEVLGALSAGHLSMVYLARRIGGDAAPLVALKRPHPGFASDTQALQAFAREARFASRITSRHVVAASELATDDDGPYFAMEYVAGPSLARLQCVEAEGANVLTRVSIPVAVRIVLDVLLALDALHETPGESGAPMRLVHANVSPSNVLVGVDGVAKLTDFGAVRVAGGAAPSGKGAFGAAVAYSAPEAIRDAPLTAGADVFSAGVLLWELCAGRRLFAAPTPQMIARQVLGAYIPDLRRIVPSLPPAVAGVCERALARDVGTRFRSARDVARALESAMNDAFGVPRHEAVAHAVRHRCAAFLEQRKRMITSPDSVLQSGVRAKRPRDAERGT